MKGDRRKNDKKAEQLRRSRVAGAVFARAEAMGIADRETKERLTEDVLKRLDQARAGAGANLTLPGMEDLVFKDQSVLVPESEIEALLKEVLGSKSTTAAKPAPEKKPEREEKIEVRVMKVDTSSPVALTPNARAVLERRYLKKNEKGKAVETPEEMFRRVARNIAAAEMVYNPQANVAEVEEQFYALMTGLDFLPNSPTLMNAGRELQQLSACFVLPVEDSMESIFDAVKYTALIHKSGGGTGFSFSRLRPESDHVGSTGGIASGPVSFIRAFDTATDVIKQGGMRRGANMAILNVEHPDVMRFIKAKEKQDAFNNFNFSVAVTEKFMRAVEDGTDYELLNPRDKKPAGKLNAKQVFDTMVQKAWGNGDPGIVFLDRINRENPTPNLGVIESTNPCGEQPLLPYESCNLGSINLARMVTQEAGRWVIDYPRLERTTRLAVRFLDNVIDMNRFPLAQIEEMTKKTRKVGLGVMGFADMLLRLGIPYDSRQALDTAEAIMKFIEDKATEASVELGQERGLFPAFKGSVYDTSGGRLVRNATRTTIAPTGTLSIIAGCSSGIEPLFALSYVRTILDNSKFVEVNPIFEEIARADGFYSPQLMEELAQKGSIQKIDGIPDRVKRLFVTALDIAPEWHVRMQAAFQRFTDNAVSKTVNFPHSATVEDVAKVYMLAYREGCKGITIYRDRSRDQQVLSTGEQKAEAKVEEKVKEKLAPRERKRETEGKTRRVDTGCGGLYVTVNKDEEGLCEVFSTLGKAGGCASAQLEAISRLISLCIRSGVDPEYIVKQLRGIRCPSIQWEEGHAVLSCPDAIGSVLDKYLAGETSAPVQETKAHAPASGRAKNLAGQCPECSGLLVYQEGCLICPMCGYTKCG